MGGNAVAFSAPERAVYIRVHNDAKAEFEKHSQRGAQFVAKHLLAIMSLLNPLRAICSGGVLREKARPHVHNDRGRPFSTVQLMPKIEYVMLCLVVTLEVTVRRMSRCPPWIKRNKRSLVRWTPT